MFNEAPDGRLHHHITWKWLNPQSRLLTGLRLFAYAGWRREDLWPDVLEAIAEFRFMASVESAVESKHAAVNMESQRRLGPVRVSLANRLSMLERLFVAKPDVLLSFCAFFRQGPPDSRYPIAAQF